MTTSTWDDSQTEELLTAAASAARPTARTSARERAAWLRGIADDLESARSDLVAIATRETRLGQQRLDGELGRTTFQARLFADRLDAGLLSDDRIDPADPAWPMGPRPDLRRTHLPVGPVVVFAASNFPFAFSVAGGDTVSAIAAGCPVLIKAHSGHPELSRATAVVVERSLAACGAPAGVFGLIEGQDAGRAAVTDPRVRAVGFTGSTYGGRALFDLAVSRPDPIPFYGELGSINPVVVTPRGWAARAANITEGFAASVTLGSGQFCTKPGVVFVPDVDGFVGHLPELVGGAMLNRRIESCFLESVREMSGRAAVAWGEVPTLSPAPVLFGCAIEDVLRDPDLWDLEMFGPAALLIDYRDLDQVLEVVEAMPGQLTGTVQAADEPDDQERELLMRLAEHAGRVLWNDWPTGVSVTDAQQHGGPYPATTAPLTTSVGTAAIWRWLRPVAFQSLPETALPTQFRDGRSETGHRLPTQERTP